MTKGKLYLLPNTISEGEWSMVIPTGVQASTLPLRNFIVENVRTARRYLRKLGFDTSFDEVMFFELNQHTNIEEIPSFLKPILEGHDMSIISESGLPCIADPGNLVVDIAHQQGIEVIPLVGPSSLFLALMASGFNGQNFAFNGYLPIEISDKLKVLKEMEKKIYHQQQTQLFIETPYRNQKLFEFLCTHAQSDTKLCIAKDISGVNQWIKTKTIRDWKKQKIDLQKQNTIFLLYQ
jgi:16S rRNA (cytidine1402-2'-O)-methyltransferase